MAYDPKDPAFEYLAIDRKAIVAAAGPHDSKKIFWALDDAEGYARCEFLGEGKKNKKKEEMVKVNVGGKEKEIRKDDMHEMNPPKFGLMEDMANMTYLNEATVLTNLKSRYEATLIYTYSGLFCVAINPYRRLPIYGMNVVEAYRGKKRTEVPPHLFQIADNAYMNTVINRENQSMLITGESGAGKTENTKKVISYFALVTTGAPQKNPDGTTKIGLEDQIVQANPVLEAYGNAKTTRNNNSSRFGKFIRIHFSATGKIAGADVDTYLLEKSRITYQMPGCERNYHVFYQLLSNVKPEYYKWMLVEPDPSKYFNINQGCLDIQGMVDTEEFVAMEDAYTVLGFNEAEKFANYKSVCAVIWLGEQHFKQVGRDEQAAPDGDKAITNVAKLLSCNPDELVESIITPRIKVGADYVKKSQNKDQASFAINALSKSLYARMFDWIVLVVNRTLDVKTVKRAYFIGVLDIAGFEIFDFNTFEQLCINFTNERLQQFFNHHMFVLEQEEYKKEGIKWAFIDFGMDLQACIDLIEKPLGILSILEEECMFPKASDKSFLDKLYENHMGKNKYFGKPKPSRNPAFEAHFELAHYAGAVGYNTTGWLNKNKDPINESTVTCLAKSEDPNIAMLFKPKEEDPAADTGGGKKGGKKGKSSAFQTISATHKESLGKLMDTLYSTHPHFVRCIIPNEKKQPGLVDAGLVLHQLRCNGVLEGIRICRKGFPNRIVYAEFKPRYAILAPNAIPKGFAEAKVITEKVLEALHADLGEAGKDECQYRIGHTKVFFKAGVLGRLEDMRDEKLTKAIAMLQAHIKIFFTKRVHKKMILEKDAITKMQNNIRTWFNLKDWNWYKLFGKLKPMLPSTMFEENMRKVEANFDKTKEELSGIEARKKEMEKQNVELHASLGELQRVVKVAEEDSGNIDARLQEARELKVTLDARVEVLEKKQEKEEGDNTEMIKESKKVTKDMEQVTKDLEEVKVTLDKALLDITGKDDNIATLQDEMARQEEAITKLLKEKKNVDETLAKTQDDISAEEDKVNMLNKAKLKLESAIGELEEHLDRENKLRGDVEKIKRKLENDLKLTQEAAEELDRNKADLEVLLRKKETEVKELQAKLEEHQSLVAQLQKKIKELQHRITELEEELEMERSVRAKCEKQRNEVSRELEEIAERLDEAGGANQAQIDLNKKREAELQKLRRDLEEAQSNSEANMVAIKKKTQDTCNELADQLDQLSKGKVKAEKDRNILKTECEDLRTQIEHCKKGASNAERLSKTLEGQLAEIQLKLDEAERQSGDLANQRARAQSENIELSRQLEEAESQLNIITKSKTTLSKQMEEAKATLEEENRGRSKLQGDYRTLQGDADMLREQLDEEQEAHGTAKRALLVAQAEMQEWRRKFESGEATGTAGPEFEEFKKKMNARLAELEALLEATITKCGSLEKNKSRLQHELEDVTLEMERSQAMAAQAERRQRAFNKTVDEWKKKVSDLQQELEMTNSDSRSHAAEVYKMRHQLDEAHEAVEAMRRENKNLSDEIHDLTDQLGEGGRSVHELEKSRKKLELEKDELQSALEEAEAALEHEEATVAKANQEALAIRGEIDKRLAEKDEEFENTRRNHQRTIDGMQAQLEGETRGKTEALRMKKKLEHDINELEVAMETAKGARGEAEKQIKKYQQQLKEIQSHIDTEHHSREEVREQNVQAERRANLLGGEIDELRAQLDAAERARKHVESELHEAADRVNELNESVATLTTGKRKMETDVQAMQHDLETQADELKATDEQAKKAMLDASMAAKELREEQENAGRMENARRGLESQCKEIQNRLDEAEAQSMKGGKRMIQKLESRVRELEVELDNEQKRHSETTKAHRQQDRRVKDLAVGQDEGRKNQDRLQILIDQLQGKIKTYKKQVDEAEEIAAINLAKYRKVQHELEDAEERADMAENSMQKLRTKGGSVQPQARGGLPERSSRASVRGGSAQPPMRALTRGGDDY